MTQISDENKSFFKTLLQEVVETKNHKLDYIRKKIIDYRQKSANITVDNAAYAKTEALEGYTIEYLKIYKELEKLLKELES